MIVKCDECGKGPAVERGLCAGCRDWMDANPLPAKGAVVREGSKGRFKGWHNNSGAQWWEDRGR